VNFRFGLTPEKKRRAIRTVRRPNMSGVTVSAKAVNNAANQYSVGYKHRFQDKHVARTSSTGLRNSDYAHYRWA